MTQISKKEIEEVERDRDYWKEIEEPLGWRLFGFTYQHHGSYIDRHDVTVNLTGSQRDDIIRALNKPFKVG